MSRLHVRSSLLIIGALAASSAASAQTRPDEHTPFLLVSYLAKGDPSIGSRAVDSLRARLRRLVPQRELFVISRKALESEIEMETPVGGWQIDDVREIAKTLHASAILEIGATRAATGIRLEPVFIRGRNSEPERLDPIEAPSLGRAAGLLAQRIASDSTLRRSYIVRHPPSGR